MLYLSILPLFHVSCSRQVPNLTGCQESKVETFKQHPECMDGDVRTWDRNLALLFVSTRFDLSPHVRPICVFHWPPENLTNFQFWIDNALQQQVFLGMGFTNNEGGGGKKFGKGQTHVVCMYVSTT